LPHSLFLILSSSLPKFRIRIQVEHVLTDHEIPSKQIWTYLVPNRAFFDPDIQTYVRDNFDWKERGASIEYDYKVYQCRGVSMFIAVSHS
jgi:hypothetical protein